MFLILIVAILFSISIALFLDIFSGLGVILYFVITLSIVTFFLSKKINHNARLFLYIYSVFLILISLGNYYQAIKIGSDVKPYLPGNDGLFYYQQAVYLTQGNILENLSKIRSNYLGYQFVLANLFYLTSTNLLVGLIFNNILIIISLILLYTSVCRVTREEQIGQYTLIAFALTFEYVFYANSLLKEPFLILAMSSLIYAISIFKTHSSFNLSAYLCILISVLIFGTMRLPMLIVVPLCFLLLGRAFLIKGWPVWLISVVAGVVLGPLFLQFTIYEFSFDYVQETAIESSLLDRSLDKGADGTGIVGQIMGGYTTLPLAIRIITLPLAIAVQFFLPFEFWSTRFIDENFIYIFSRNLKLFWYTFVGVFVLYALYKWKRISNSFIKNSLLLGIALYASIAFTYGGVVPRYATPYIILMLPAVGYWIHQYRFYKSSRVSIRNFFGIYYFIFICAGFAYTLFQLAR